MQIKPALDCAARDLRRVRAAFWISLPIGSESEPGKTCVVVDSQEPVADFEFAGSHAVRVYLADAPLLSALVGLPSVIGDERPIPVEHHTSEYKISQEDGAQRAHQPEEGRLVLALG